MSGMEERRGARLFLELDEPASMHTNMLFRLSGTVHASFFVAPLLTLLTFVRCRYPLFLIIVPFGAVFYDVFVFPQLVHRQRIVPNLWTGWESQGLGPQRPVTY
jgi:hypothetical protein